MLHAFAYAFSKKASHNEFPLPGFANAKFDFGNLRYDDDDDVEEDEDDVLLLFPFAFLLLFTRMGNKLSIEIASHSPCNHKLITSFPSFGMHILRLILLLSLLLLLLLSERYVVLFK